MHNHGLTHGSVDMKHILITDLGVIKFGKVSIEVVYHFSDVLVPAFPSKWCCEEGMVDFIQDVTAVKSVAVELIKVNRSYQSSQPKQPVTSSDWSEKAYNFGSPNSPNVTAHLLKVRMASTRICGMLG